MGHGHEHSHAHAHTHSHGGVECAGHGDEVEVAPADEVTGAEAMCVYYCVYIVDYIVVLSLFLRLRVKNWNWNYIVDSCVWCFSCFRLYLCSWCVRANTTLVCMYMCVNVRMRRY